MEREQLKPKSSPAAQPVYEIAEGKLVIRFPIEEEALSVRLYGHTFRADEGPSVIVGGQKRPVENLV